MVCGISAEAYNWWKWRGEMQPGLKTQYSPYDEVVPPGWTPPIGTWQPELRKIPKDIYPFIDLDNRSSHAEEEDGHIVPTLDIQKVEIRTKFPMHQPAALISLPDKPHGEEGA